MGQNDSDIALINGIREGDSRSFETVFRLYGEALVRYAVTIVKDHDEAEDIIQQLFVSIWTKREALNINTSLKNYLYRSAYNSSLNKIKQQTVKDSYADHFSYVSDGMAVSAAYGMEQKEANAIVQQAIEDLPEQCRLIFRLSRFEQLKYQQIADQLGISVKTVENQMGKALKHMRSRLKDLMTILIYLILNN